ncbi:MAG: tRNA pseudouridine(38-40) synthase TruA [Bacteroidota bacterium]|nr:tRNA pseudouridine(38-40) synthase TruA [Candidatus Kapabacteria bacterium]MCS7302123.1 tRNA pseudouridine(38-40) synthase TruA [Candidatus Kapabacteria bacterium]MCX7936485.1 tRNA pseudouridine(38-40) synthase TruA [Chlorobiota bacterium]MDW8074646.1 tRNA pseudouridine(38-40) synthase TruA [Bacteroidota bacterium]MDW8270878.1 tRNA pseudouridine(38-40) synthase TruA [Bacteroidota bacterium]
MPTVVLKVAYDGTEFVGMQRQPNGRTVEQVISEAIEKILGERSSVVAAGRTDAGVHARGMVVHSRLQCAPRVPQQRIANALNSALPEDVRILGVHVRDDDQFHARYDAIRRVYSYTINCCQDPLNRRYEWQVRFPFDPEVLKECSRLFIGTHDFTTFSKQNASQHSYICSVEQCEWQSLGKGRYRLEIAANRFVYGMVRALVGAMVDCARGKRSLQELADALDARDRRLASPLAPPHGLVFEAVEYPPHLGVVFHNACLCA